MSEVDTKVYNEISDILHENDISTKDSIALLYTLMYGYLAILLRLGGSLKDVKKVANKSHKLLVSELTLAAEEVAKEDSDAS